MKRFHWQLFALSTLSFSVSIENFGFNTVVFVKNVLLNCKMSQMYVSHSRVALDLENILQCGSAESKTAKVVEDIASEYSVEVQALKNLEYFKLKNLSDDSLGQSLLPKDLPSNLEAEGLQLKKATSNGNCLYNSASIILNGNEDLSLLLRLLTAVELYKNAPFYATHPNFT